MDQDAVVGIQRHHVGDATQCHQVEQLAQIGLRTAGEPAGFAQPRTQRQQHVEHHADAGHGLAGEFAAWLVRVDDGISGRQFRPWQVVIGNQHRQPGGLGRRHAIDAGDAVVDGQQQVGLAFEGHGDDLRGQAIAVLEAVRYQVIDMRRTEQAQTEHADRTGGGAVGIEVADDKDALALRQRLDQQLDRRVDALQLLIRDQPRQALVQFLGGLHATGGVEASQQRRQAAQIRQLGG